MKIDISFRQSDLEMADKCLEATRRRYRAPIIEPTTSDMARGNAVHAAIELVGNDMLVHGEATPIDIADTQLEECMEAEFAAVEVWRDDRFKVEAITRLNFEAWYWEVLPNLEVPTSVEGPFRVLLDEDEERRIWLTGTMDWVQSDRIIDWKNPSRPYARWEKQRWDNQSTVYSYAVASETGDWSPKKFDLCMLCNGNVHWVHITRDEADWAALRDKCRALADLVAAPLKVWPQAWNSWYCSPKWCTAWDTCRGQFYPKGEPW